MNRNWIRFGENNKALIVTFVKMRAKHDQVSNIAFSRYTLATEWLYPLIDLVSPSKTSWWESEGGGVHDWTVPCWYLGNEHRISCNIERYTMRVVLLRNSCYFRVEALPIRRVLQLNCEICAPNIVIYKQLSQNCPNTSILKVTDRLKCKLYIIFGSVLHHRDLNLSPFISAILMMYPYITLLVDLLWIVYESFFYLNKLIIVWHQENESFENS